MQRDKNPKRPFVEKDSDNTAERIAKRLARAGIASRREAESMIAAGRIRVNGKIIDRPALNVTREDVISVDGKPLSPSERTRLWLYHKPAGLVTTMRDEQGRPTVFANLPDGMPRVISVGRLDINTEGLLLLTNDGGLARILELPATGWLRRYRVRAHGRIGQTALAELKNGIAIDGIFYGSIEATIEREQGSNVWLSIGLREGKNREVKNILRHLGLEVTRLIRVSYGPFQLGDLGVGEVQEIRGRTLQEQLGERLIEAANADFEAPILTPMARKSSAGRQELAKSPIGKTRGKREWISSQPPQKRAAKMAAPGQDEKKKPRAKSNTTNVWMAPGARPQAKKKYSQAFLEKLSFEPRKVADFSEQVKSKGGVFSQKKGTKQKTRAADDGVNKNQNRSREQGSFAASDRRSKNKKFMGKHPKPSRNF